MVLTDYDVIITFNLADVAKPRKNLVDEILDLRKNLREISKSRGNLAQQKKHAWNLDFS